MPTGSPCHIQVQKILHYFRHFPVATTNQIIDATGVPPHAIRRMISDKTLTSSLNHNHTWLIPSEVVRKNKDHWGFYRIRPKKYSRTVITCHIKRDTKSVLSYLASRRPWGLTEKEAKDMLGRPCKRALEQLVSKHSIQVRVCCGERLYLNRYGRKAEDQTKQRRTNPRLKKDKVDEKENEKVGFITYEQFCDTFRKAIEEMPGKISVSNERLCSLLLMPNTNHTLRTMENWLLYNPRVREATGMKIVVDHTTFCRAFNEVSEEYLKDLFHHLVLKLHSDGVITGRFLAVDATHTYAYCNTRKDTNTFPVEGASWGNHHGSFYGYKVHIIIDAESELPIAMVFSTGKDYDSPHFVPLFEQFDEHYNFKDVIAVLADGAYDVKSYREIVHKSTGGLFLPACNPRNSTILKVLKKRVKNLFKRHGSRIQTVEDGLKFSGQKFLKDYGIDVGTKREGKLVELIAERLHRPHRAAVERTFSRLKALSAFERPKARNPESVRKMAWWCIIGQLIHAMTAIGAGFKGSMRKRTALV